MLYGELVGNMSKGQLGQNSLNKTMLSQTRAYKHTRSPRLLRCKSDLRHGVRDYAT